MEIDEILKIAAPGVSLGIDARLAVGKEADPEHKHDLLNLSRPATLSASYLAANPALTYGFLAFPTVTPGKLWEVLRVAVYQLDATAAALLNVTSVAYVSSFVPQDSASAPAFSQVLGVAGQVPDTIFPGRRVTTVRGMERVIVCFRGLANSQQVVADLSIIEHDAETYMRSMRG